MFREDKATQMAAKFIKLSGGRLPYIHLIKMMYIADREKLFQTGLPVTFDNWVAMEHGPVLSRTYNRIRRDGSENYWSQNIRTEGYDVVLVNDPGDDALSEREDSIIANTFASWGKHDRWVVRDFTHTFPEWSDPGKSSLPISYRSALELNGFSPEVADEAERMLDASNVVAELGRP